MTVATLRTAAALGRRVLSALLMLSGLLLGCNGASAADAVLLTSTAPGYVPGAVIGADERMRLPDGASVTLLLRSGQLLRLRGPADTVLDLTAAPRREGAAMAEAFRMRGVDATVIGASRASGPARPQPRPQEVMVDAQRSGTYCVGPADTVWLTRATAGVSDIILRRRRFSRSLAWPQGADRIEWPADLPIQDGDRFEVLADGTQQATLTFRAVAATAASEAAAIAEAVLLGCHEQQEGALRRLARAAAPRELWLTTDRGRNPVYRSGEPIALTAVASMDGWLTCVLMRADGTAVPVLAGGRLPAAVPVAVPGPRRDAALRAGPRGAERIRCWLSDRDIASELPGALLGPPDTRLPDNLTADLDAVFSQTGNSGVTAASLPIRVE
jgi:hypothetical protein